MSKLATLTLMLEQAKGDLRWVIGRIRLLRQQIRFEKKKEKEVSV